MEEDKHYKRITLGGSLQTALNGEYELKATNVIKEAWQLTLTHLLSFTPAILTLVIVQLLIFYVAIEMQVGLPALIELFSATEMTEAATMEAIGVVWIASMSYEVVSAPLFASLCLMAMSHSIGMKTKFSHIMKGSNFTIPIILLTFIILLLQLIASQLPFPFSSFIYQYFFIAFSHSILLVCDKKQSIFNALLLSVRASNKKILTLVGVYLFVLIVFIIAMLMYGLGLFFAIPFYFHVRAVLYRSMFGVEIMVLVEEKPSDTQSNSQSANSFDA